MYQQTRAFKRKAKFTSFCQSSVLLFHFCPLEISMEHEIYIPLSSLSLSLSLSLSSAAVWNPYVTEPKVL